MTGAEALLFCIGWVAGSAGMWAYFAWAGMLRTREEWEDAQR